MTSIQNSNNLRRKSFATQMHWEQKIVGWVEALHIGVKLTRNRSSAGN
ncbi:MAG: hypothetical protein V7L22_22575 [Nostoc sp.]